ncbi:MAG: hypothetical protein WKF97_23050 [Chitinophagaceae bacterium]
MANPATDQNQQIEMDSQGIKADNLKSLSRRSWLRKAAITATSAVMLLLVLNSCTKEQWDDVIGKVPRRGVGGNQNTWYNLRVTYKDEDGKTLTRFMGPIADKASTSFWDYMQIGGAQSKFKLHPTKDGWAYWEIDDGNWLSLKSTGWAYRSLESNRIEWKIVDGKLYNSYWSSDWQRHPLGTERRRILVPDAYYVGVDLSNNNVFTCELVLAP